MRSILNYSNNSGSLCSCFCLSTAWWSYMLAIQMKKYEKLSNQPKIFQPPCTTSADPLGVTDPLLKTSFVEDVKSLVVICFFFFLNLYFFYFFCICTLCHLFVFVFIINTIKNLKVLYYTVFQTLHLGPSSPTKWYSEQLGCSLLTVTMVPDKSISNQPVWAHNLKKVKQSIEGADRLLSPPGITERPQEHI